MFAQKVKLIEAVKNTSIKKANVAINFGIPYTTLASILKNEKGSMMKKLAGGNLNRKRAKNSDIADVKECLLK